MTRGAYVIDKIFWQPIRPVKADEEASRTLKETRCGRSTRSHSDPNGGL